MITLAHDNAPDGGVAHTSFVIEREFVALLEGGADVAERIEGTHEGFDRLGRLLAEPEA
jgi:hypothetical protein